MAIAMIMIYTIALQDMGFLLHYLLKEATMKKAKFDIGIWQSESLTWECPNCLFLNVDEIAATTSVCSKCKKEFKLVESCLNINSCIKAYSKLCRNFS